MVFVSLSSVCGRCTNVNEMMRYGEKLTMYLLQQAMFAFVLVHAALRPSLTVRES